MQVTVVGGTYSEFCFDPYWNELYGSGLRGAAAISGLCNVTLFTYISKAQTRSLEIVAKTFGIESRPSPTDFTGAFIYQHPLAQPILEFHQGSSISSPLSINADVLIRYGMIEGDAVTHAQYAVYDPQDPVNPRMYDANGSTAAHLAIVVNSSEAKRLTGNSDIEAAGRALLTSENTDVVVVKRGPLGASVFTKDAVSRVLAYQTENVWPIGSGDVFSAAFAYFWGAQQLQPLVAARLSSLAASYYCGHKTLPIPSDIETRPEPPTVEIDEARVKRATVYLAAPFFNMSDRWLVEQAREALCQQPINVFSPFHDVGLGLAENVVPADIKGLEECSVVLAMLDHFDPGTIFEVGWARRKNIPVVAFLQNERQEDLKMFSGTGCEIVDDFASAVYRAVWRAIGP